MGTQTPTEMPGYMATLFMLRSEGPASRSKNYNTKTCEEITLILSDESEVVIPIGTKVTFFEKSSATYCTLFTEDGQYSVKNGWHVITNAATPSVGKLSRFQSGGVTPRRSVLR